MFRCEGEVNFHNAISRHCHPSGLGDTSHSLIAILANIISAWKLGWVGEDRVMGIYLLKGKKGRKEV